MGDGGEAAMGMVEVVVGLAAAVATMVTGYGKIGDIRDWSDGCDWV